jgi:acyl-CoA thioester hydrolase
MDDWDYPAPFLHTVRVQESDIDMLDHANNMAYIGWCQDTAWLHSGALGIDAADYRRLDRAMAVRSARYDYLAAALAGEELQIGTWISGSDGRLQMRRHFQVRRCTDGITVFRGDWELVCIRISSGKPVRMPETFLRCYVPAVIDVGDGRPSTP